MALSSSQAQDAGLSSRRRRFKSGQGYFAAVTLMARGGRTFNPDTARVRFPSAALRRVFGYQPGLILLVTRVQIPPPLLGRVSHLLLCRALHSGVIQWQDAWLLTTSYWFDPNHRSGLRSQGAAAAPGAWAARSGSSMVRASACRARGWGFESPLDRESWSNR
jgi:hypothetical protein